jgi:anaerobic ribonucleoside-triphosphate reductase activating protein
MTALEVAQRFEEATRLESLEGVTFSGGEPMQQGEALLEVMREIRRVAPAVSLGMFTGYTESELAAGRYVTRPRATAEQKRELWRTIQELLDFAVMGRYEETLPVKEPLRTSRNQRLVLFTNRYQDGDFGPQLLEISIAESGKSVLTGFPVRTTAGVRAKVQQGMADLAAELDTMIVKKPGRKFRFNEE